MKPPEKTVKELLQMLDQLKLNTMSAELEPILAEAASRNLTTPEVMLQLAQRELEERRKRARRKTLPPVPPADSMGHRGL